MSYDILIEALKRSGYGYTVRWVPFVRLKDELMEKGTIDVSNTFFYKDVMPAEKQILYDLGGLKIARLAQIPEGGQIGRMEGWKSGGFSGASRSTRQRVKIRKEGDCRSSC